MPMIDSILLIDDDDVNNYINARLLKKLAITENVNVSVNGEEALKYLHRVNSDASEFPDLILLDINMPVMDGFEFLQQFSSINFTPKEPVVIMLTTSSNEKDMGQIAFYPRVAGFLNKPLTEEKMQTIVQQFFSQLPGLRTQGRQDENFTE